MTNNLIIDNKSLELTSDTIKMNDYFNTIKEFNWYYEPKRQFFIANFDNRLSFKRNNNYTISIGFKGLLNEDNAGLYISSYDDSNDKKR
jgi:hypothetical protein